MTKILVKQFENSDLIEKFHQCGYETTTQLEDSFDFVYPGVIPGALTRHKNLVDYGIAPTFNIDIMLKNKLEEVLLKFGFDRPLTLHEASIKNINTFNATPFIIKPNIGLSAFDGHNFTYKIWKNSLEFFHIINQDEFNEFINSGIYKDYIVQQSLDNDGLIHQLFVSGFVNSKSEIFFEGITDVYMIYDNRQEDERIGTNGEISANLSKFPSNFKRLENTYCDSNIISDKCDFKNQIQRLFKLLDIKSVPFIFQAIVDPNDDTKCYLTDMAYKIRPYNIENLERHEYLKDKIDFMYKDSKINILDKLHYTYPTLDTCNGVSKSLKKFLKSENISSNWIGSDNKLALTFCVGGNSFLEMNSRLQKLKVFLSSAEYLYNYER